MRQIGNTDYALRVLQVDGGWLTTAEITDRLSHRAGEGSTDPTGVEGWLMQLEADELITTRTIHQGMRPVIEWKAL